ncbi:MAG: WYL domain-containing protein [Gammaproteobacteria bacterium]|nr:WYL domain-containing protein [Gammaproteobacteria bacterium]
MDRTERFYKIQRLLTERRVVPRDVFLENLSVSRATFKRDLEYLRDRMRMPIVWDRAQGGYRIDETDPDAHTHQLPGLWFSAEEIHALLTMEHLLEGLQPGMLTNLVRPLVVRIRQILGTGDYTSAEVSRRIKIIQIGVRPVEHTHFQAISSALLSRHRLRITHHGRQSGESLTREVSPQRLVYYRDNWYLDAWCHLRKALRTFSLDGVESATVLGKRARDIKEQTLDETLGAGFGIFSGHATQTAILRFDPIRARWVSKETWHSQQEGGFELDGAYVLKVPYSDPRELVMDILKYGEDVEVLAPAELRQMVRKQLTGAKRLYPEQRL